MATEQLAQPGQDSYRLEGKGIYRGFLGRIKVDFTERDVQHFATRSYNELVAEGRDPMDTSHFFPKE